jgi:hypothetical protein
MRVRGRVRRACRPGLERVEGRELLSGLMVALAANKPNVTAADLLANQLSGIHADATGNGAGGSGSSGLIQGLGNGFGPDNTSSPLLGQGTPTPQELNREAFKAGFAGRYYTGPGRFSDQGTTYFYRGIGSSSDFLHGDFDMAVVTPTDPTAPFIGEAVLQDKNNNSSALIGLILRGDRTKVDALGRPTVLQFVADPNIYSGAFFVAAAEGTISLTYGPGPNHPITAIFRGRVYTSGVTNPLVNMDLYARHNRPLRFRGH